jgi:hypothetical protein
MIAFREGMIALREGGIALRGRAIALRVGVALASALLVAGCVTYTYTRDMRFAPIDDAALDCLRPGEADITECLEKLGAPLYVWEYSQEGVALAYGFDKDRAWSLTVSVPVARGFSASGSYTDQVRKLRGAVLLFDPAWRLQIVRRGMLADLSAELRHKRPAIVESTDDEGFGAPSDAPLRR